MCHLIYHSLCLIAVLLFFHYIAGVPLNKLDAYYEKYCVDIECKMLDFASKKILGFNPTLGYAYCEFTFGSSVVRENTIILMNEVGFGRFKCIHYHGINNFFI